MKNYNKKSSKTRIKSKTVPISDEFSYDKSILSRSISAGLFIVDRDMKVRWQNTILDSWFKKLDRDQGKNCYKVYRDMDTACTDCPAIKVFENGYQNCSRIHSDAAAKGQDSTSFKVTAIPVMAKNGSIDSAIVLLENVTDVINLDSRLTGRLSTVTKELDLLSELDRQFITLQDVSLDNILKQCAGTAQVLLGSKVCNLRLIDDSRNTVVSKTTYGLGKEYFKGAHLWEEISGMVVLAKRPIVIKDLNKWKYANSRELFKKRGLHSALSVPIVLKKKIVGTLTVYDKRKGAFLNSDRRRLSYFANHVAILLDNVNTHKEVFISYVNSIKSLVSAIEAKDFYTKGHSEKVTKFALDIAEAIGISDEERQMLTYCGRLHDIGKIGIPDSILNKPGPLTPEERKEIQLHPLKSVEILSDLKFLEKGIPIIRHHHERYDGRGYPDGLKGKEIPYLARILVCADSFDAMTSDRAYKAKKSIKEALCEIEENRASQFDPEISDIFIGVIEDLYL